MLPGSGLYRCSVSVSGTAFRLRSHILMLSAAGAGLTVWLCSVGLITPGGGVAGYDDADLSRCYCMSGAVQFPLFFAISHYAHQDNEKPASV